MDSTQLSNYRPINCHIPVIFSKLERAIGDVEAKLEGD